jgi:hypothetical protein
MTGANLLDLSALTLEQLAAINAVAPSSAVTAELQRRSAFLSLDEGMDAVALVLARIEHFKETNRVTEVARKILVDLGVESVLHRLLDTAEVKGMDVKVPTLDEVTAAAKQ